MPIDITSKPGSSIKNKTGGWRTFMPKTDLNKCIGCGTCVKTCPEDAIKMVKQENGELKPETDYDFCKGCGLCAQHCPVKAITMERDMK